MTEHFDPQPADYPEPAPAGYRDPWGLTPGEHVDVRPVSTAEDRSMAIPPGALVKTAYVEIHKVRLACRERMAIGDVERAYQRQLQLGDKQRWPCPRGHWAGDWFIIVDGRHAYVASLMLGLTHVLVAWVE